MSNQPKPATSQPDSDKHAVTITLKAAASEVSPVVDQVMQMLRETNCAPGSEMEIEIAFREALANAIKHGADSDPSKIIECRISCEAPGILIVVSDPGKGFDPDKIPNPLEGENIYSNHGRGIYMINHLMDEVKFEKNGTEIHMRKY